MVKSVSTLLNEADEILVKTAAAKNAIPADDVIKIAKQLKDSGKISAEGLSDENLAVKIAHAFAIVDTVINLEEMAKVAFFEEKAKEAGFSDGKVSEYIEKKASPKFVSALSLVPWLNR